MGICFIAAEECLEGEYACKRPFKDASWGFDRPATCIDGEFDVPLL